MNGLLDGNDRALWLSDEVHVIIRIPTTKKEIIMIMVIIMVILIKW